MQRLVSALPGNIPGKRITARITETGLAGFTMSLLAAGHAFAAGASPTGSLGAQVATMSSEGIDAGGQLSTAICYVSAMVIFIGAGWALWQSRQPQNRETGKVGMGVAGLVLCGLLVMMPQWINKASHTVAGADASINNTPQEVTFAP